MTTLLVFSSDPPYAAEPGRAPSVGGAEHALRWTAEAAAAQGWRVVYAALDARRLTLAPGVERRTIGGVDVRFLRPVAAPTLSHVLTEPRLGFLRVELAKIMREIKPDIALSYAPDPDTWLLLEARRLAETDTRIVERVSGRLWEKGLLGGGASAERVRRAFTDRDATIYASRFIRGYTQSVLNRVRVEPGGAEIVADLSSQPGQASAALLPPHLRAFLEGREKPISFIGRFMYGSKRQDVAIEALSLLRDRGIKPAVVFAGDGELLEQTIRHAEELGVDDQCMFAGALSAGNIAALVDASALGLLLTDFEGSSRASLDYLLRGVPVLMTDIPGNAEHLEFAPELARMLLCGASPVTVASRLEKLLAQPLAYEAAHRHTVALAPVLADSVRPQAFVLALQSVVHHSAQRVT